MMSTGARKQHLTDLEFGDLLAGDCPGEAAELHLAGCDYCRQELDAVGDSLGSFRTLSTAWAQSEAPRRVPMPSRLALGLGMRPSWGAGVAATAMAALLAVGMGLPGGSSTARSMATPPPVPPSNTELANDNRLMLSIDQELSAQAQPAVPASDLRSEARRDAQHPGDSVLD
jgi:hypothetical protein